MLMVIAFMQAQPLWDANYFEGAWAIRRDDGRASCRVMLTRNPDQKDPRLGYMLHADQRCLERMGMKGLARWMTRPGGISFFGAERRFMGSYSRLNADTLKGWAPPRVRYTMTRDR